MPATILPFTSAAAPLPCGRFFAPPPQTGRGARRILAAFSQSQRIGKGANVATWFADIYRACAGLPIEWAAIRQFELLRDADNLAIEDLDVADTRRAFQAMQKMRGGGYRITHITLGDYYERDARDDLAFLDQKLQEEITRLVNLWYLEELSGQATEENHAALHAPRWSLADALPHVFAARAARRLFKPERQTQAEQNFFALLQAIPARHILHDTAVGLVLPDKTKEKNWTYIAAPEFRFAAFQTAMTSVLGGLDRTMATMRHMRGHGDRLRNQPQFEIA